MCKKGLTLYRDTLSAYMWEAATVIDVVIDKWFDKQAKWAMNTWLILKCKTLDGQKWSSFKTGVIWVICAVYTACWTLKSVCHWSLLDLTG